MLKLGDAVPVLNTAGKRTALGRYARDLSMAMNLNLLSLRLDRFHEREDFDKDIVDTNTPHFIGKGWYMSLKFPGTFTSDALSFINRGFPDNRIIHYASQEVH